jgi:hypothetical protein
MEMRMGCRHRFFGFFSYFSALVQSHKFLDGHYVNHQTTNQKERREMSKITQKRRKKTKRDEKVES